MNLPEKPIFSRKKTAHLCYMSAMLGFQEFSNWIINNIPEAAYLISDYKKKHPNEYQEFFDEDLKDSDHILDKAEKMMVRLDTAKKMGYEPEEMRYLK